MLRPSQAMQRIADAIARKPEVAAVLVPKRLALTLIAEMHPDGEGVEIDRARRRYVELVERGGYIGLIMSVPMVVADDVVVCPLTELELRDAASRLGVDLSEVVRDRRRHK